MRNALILICCVAAYAPFALADIVYLTNGGTIEGKVTERDGKVIIEQPNGTITIPASRVEHIERKVCDLEIFENLWAAVDAKAPGAAGRFVELARWCRQRRMDNQARDCYRHALDFDPDCAEARTALGFARYEGRWLTEDELAVARGMVRHGNAWVTPEAKADLLRLQAEKEAHEARVEAARARAAADRARAEAAAEEAQLEAARARYYDVSPLLYMTSGYRSSPWSRNSHRSYPGAMEAVRGADGRMYYYQFGQPVSTQPAPPPRP
jgi:hypothetical protein